MPPRNTNTIVLNDYRKYPQVHGSIVVAFHLEVFRVSLFIFSQRKARCKESNMDMNKITYLHSEPIVYDRGKWYFKDSGHISRPTQG